MMGKDHFLISLAWAFLLLVPVLLQYPMYALAFIIGIALGSVYPDIDSSHNPFWDNSHNGLEEGNGVLTWLMGLVAYPAKHLTGFVFSRGDKKTKKDYLDHRNLMHSILGILFSLSVILIPVNLILHFIGCWNPAILIGSIGVLAGAFMHLMEDSCTLAGVKFLYPIFKKELLKGKIRVSTNSAAAGKLFSVLFAFPAIVYLAYDLVLKDSQYFSQYGIIDKLSFLDGLSPELKIGMMAVVSIFIWLLCFGISQAKSWSR